MEKASSKDHPFACNTPLLLRSGAGLRWAAALPLLLPPPSPSHCHLRENVQSQNTSKRARKRTCIGLFVIRVDDERSDAAFPCGARVPRKRTGPLACSILQRSRTDNISAGGAAQWSWVPSAVDRRHREVTSAVLGTGFKSPNGMAAARFHDPDWNPRCGSWMRLWWPLR